MGSLPSLRQDITGIGDPDAAHFNVTLLPSLTIMSVLVGSSNIFGGTVGNNYRIFIAFL